MRVPSVCLTGVDTTHEDGTLRVIVSVVSNGDYEVQLRLRNVTPDEQTRFAIVSRQLQVGANAVGIDVPLLEGGKHEISASLFARYTDDGEFSEIFSMAPSVIDVPFTHNGLVVESATIALSGDVVEVYAAVRRQHGDAPRKVTLILRDKSLGLATTVEKELSEELTVVGLNAPVDAGVHMFQASIAVEENGELVEVLPVNPVRV